MKHSILSLILAFSAFTGLKAQYPVVTIEDIQTVTASALGNCDDQTIYLGDTVIIRAKVVMDGLSNAVSGLVEDPPSSGNWVPDPSGRRNLWIQQGQGGTFSGLDVFSDNDPNISEDPHNLVAGDSVEIIGYIDDYNGETEIFPLEGSSISILGQGLPIYSTPVDIADLNDDERNNKLETGEQWEGTYVEITGATVASVDFFSGGSRVSFNIEDQFGNLLNVSDRFKVQKLPAEGGTFVAPNVGDQLDTVRGVIAHSKNNCPGFNGRGYELYPFDEGDYVYGAAAPRIFNIARTPLVPSSAQDVGVSADITDNDGTVSSATLYYATGPSGGSFTSVAMSFVSGETYSADIPAQADGTLVRWYISAEDDSGLVTTLPSNDPSNNTYLYRVRNNGLSIFDLQYTPYSNGISPYVDETVSVEGIVTSSVNSSDTGDLGYVYIQQEGQLTYAGIWLRQGSTISQLNRGDKVTVEGVVTESFGMTALTDISSVNVNGTGTIDPIVLNPDSFSLYSSSQEPMEAMLVRMEHPTTGERLYVVEQNADEITGNNYAEYRIGTDEFNPAVGSRVIAGRQTGNSTSSLYVSFVNDSLWTTSSGVMNVDPYIVQYGHSLESMTGILLYSFGNMKVLPRNNNDIVGYGDAAVTALFQAAADTVCVQDSIQFFNQSSVIADQFAWNFGDNQTSNSEDPYNVYSNGGWFTVSLEATNSVDGASDLLEVSNAIYVDSSEACLTGVREKGNDVQATAYPNPSQDVLHIATQFDPGTIYTIHVYDMQGRELMKRITRRNKETLHLDALESGQYFVEVRDGNGVSVDVLRVIKN